jgi:antitoxin (DNA-binding transcriptional repressor) of toxin-antitoxin stability system
MKRGIQTINTKQLRSQMAKVIERVRKGDSFLVLHRSRPAFQIIPSEFDGNIRGPLEEDPIYRAAALGRSQDGIRSADHDRILYK